MIISTNECCTITTNTTHNETMSVALNQCALSYSSSRSLWQNNACRSPESVCSMQVAVAEQCLS